MTVYSPIKVPNGPSQESIYFAIVAETKRLNRSYLSYAEIIRLPSVKKMNLTPGTISTHLSKMVRAGYLKRVG